MAFIRAYTAQGDPRFRYTTMRAGRLVHAKILSNMRGRRGNTKRRRLVLGAGDPRAARRMLLAGDPFSRSMRMPAGDPFSFRVPKFLKKLTLKKVGAALALPIKGAGVLAQGLLKLAPSVLPFLPGGAALAPFAAAAAGAFSDHEMPAPQGPPGAVAAGYQGYQVPGVEVEGTYTGARSRGAFVNTHEDEGEDGDNGEDLNPDDTGTDADTGDEDTDTGDDAGDQETP